MEERKITNTQMESYHQYLIREEKKHGNRGEISPGCSCFCCLCW